MYHRVRRRSSTFMCSVKGFNTIGRLHRFPVISQVHQMMTQQQHQPPPPPSQLPDQNLNHHSTNSVPSTPYSGYLSFPCHRVVSFRPDKKCVLESDSGQRTVVQVSKALVLIGSHPNLSFLEDNGRQLGTDPDEPISCRRNPIDVDPFTNRVVSTEAPGMYAMGPLVGENFVRFLKGGALAIASDLSRCQRIGFRGSSSNRCAEVTLQGMISPMGLQCSPLYSDSKQTGNEL